MKDLSYSFTAILFFILLTGTLNAQISLTATAGTTTASYSTLKASFDAINAGTHRGVITIAVTGNTTEAAAATLNASGSGSASYTGITISPSGGAARTISGSLNGSLIALNGADYVTIDGLNSGGDSLIIENANTGTSAAAIQLTNTATYDNITNCTVLGSTGYSTGAYSKYGVITFNGTGNSNIQITHCNIGPSGSNKPSACINSTYHTGGTSNVTVSYCNIYDFYAGGATSTIGAGIYLGYLSSTTTNDSWTISHNSFYQTATLTATSGKLLAIYIHLGNNYNISNNYFGGSQTQCGGTAMTINGTAYAMGFLHVDGHFSYLGISNASGSNTLSGNIISNINFYSSNTTNTGDYSDGARFFACTIHSGNWAITNNTIGSMSSNGSIIIEDANQSTYDFIHIFGSINAASGPVISSISGNNIGGVTINSTNADISFIYISYQSAGYKAQVDLISNNTIGSALANSISAPNANNASRYLRGLQASVSNTTSLVNITGNTFQNINLNLCGIYFITTTRDIICTSNIFRNISTTNGSNFTAISVNSTDNYANSTISGNFIADCKAATTVNGIAVSSSNRTVTIANNIVVLGGEMAGNTTVYGINENYLHNVYFNTVYIEGTVTSGTANSYAYYRNSGSTGTTNVRNNIFFNARTNSGGSGSHYAAYFGATTTLTLDYNDYFVNGTGGKIGYYTSDVTTWSNASLGASSLNVNPSFTSAGSATATDYLPQNNSLLAVTGTGITTDYAATTRSTSAPSFGAYEYAVTATVTITASAGTATGSFNSLRAALAAINAGTHQGVISVMINASSTENSSATLNASGSGSASYTSVNIYPTSSGLSISGNLTTPLIDLSGAVNVTIDGRVNAAGSTKDMVIVNTNTSSSASTSTIRFINDAQNNTVKYCTIKGSTNDASGGVLFFSTTTGATGNTGNVIDNCNITKNAAAYPKYMIYSVGTAAKENIATISNNNLYDFSGAALWAAGYSKTWIISGNSIYQTATITAFTQSELIRVQGGDGFEIYGNYLGGSAPECAGTAWTVNNAGTYIFNGIEVYGTTTPASKVYNNTIKNINITSVGSTSPFVGIYCYNGNVNIGTDGANTIGSTTGTGNIVVNSNYTGNAGLSIGIQVPVGTTGTKEIKNNIIGSIDVGNTYTTSGSGHKFYGIFVGAGTATITGNVIGSTSTTNSINATNNQNAGTAANNQEVLGIYATTSSALTISNNTIANLNNSWLVSTASGYGYVRGIKITSTAAVTVVGNSIYSLSSAQPMTASGSQSNIIGLEISAASATPITVTGNTIYNLINSSTSYAGYIAGLYYAGSTSGTNLVSGNLIHSLFAPGATSTAATIYGINISSGATTYANNIISLGGDTKTTLYGIYETGSAGNNNSLYFNTVYLGGTVASGATNKSYALYSNASTNTRNFRNNILSNARSTTAGSNLHYAAWFNYAVNTGLTLDYNDYYAPGTGGVLGYYGAANKTGLPLVTANDANSYIINPSFDNAGGSTAPDYFLSASVTGVAGTGITTDYSGSSRSATPRLGAWEVNFLLPINLISFTGNKSGNSNYLQWVTSNDINVNNFEIERSSDGLNFISIGSVNNYRNPSTYQYYNYKDLKPVTGRNYYRLKQVDINGMFEYSAIISITNSSVISQVLVYPNPTSGFVTIETSAAMHAATIRLLDISGKIIMQKTNITGSSCSFDITKQPSGIYFAELIDGVNMERIKIVKQ